MKKLLIHFSVFVLFFGMIPSYISAVKDYQVDVAVYCKDEQKGQEFIDLMCQRQSQIIVNDAQTNLKMTAMFTDAVNTVRNSTVIYVPDIDTNYHIQFNLLQKVDKSITNKCCGAIILYDISDKSLDPIVKHRGGFPSQDVERLLKTKTPLTEYINALQYKISWGIFSGKIGWYGGLTFVTYGKNNMTSSNYQFRQEQINRFTCESEPYYKLDNKWGRGHQDMSTENSYKKTLYWIHAAAYRALAEGWVSGKHKLDEEEKSSDLLFGDEENVHDGFYFIDFSGAESEDFKKKSSEGYFM